MMDAKAIPSFKSKLASIRQQRQLTQSQLAQQTGIDQAVISQLERDRMEMTLTKLFRFARAFNCLPSELVNDEAYLAMRDRDLTERSAS